MSASEPVVITCPSCGTRYRVSRGSLGPVGKTVRCSRCSHRWFAEAPKVDEPPPPLPEGVRALELEATAPPPRRGLALAGWLLVVLFVLVVAGLVVGRNEIVAAFPRVAPWYERLGLPVRVPLGLEIRNLRSERRVEDGLPMLVIRGDVHNVSDAPRPVPPLRVRLLDAAGEELDSGLFDAPVRELPPGGTTRFEARMVDPPRAAVRYEVTFDPRIPPREQEG
ncbi:hypothetical protein HRbin39_00334 [bacterium HR39]|nr:hypothetical protein HRbin39_00334 [bacterium HR39]